MLFVLHYSIEHWYTCTSLFMYAETFECPIQWVDKLEIDSAFGLKHENPHKLLYNLPAQNLAISTLSIFVLSVAT
jgi:hypothetical protein